MPGRMEPLVKEEIYHIVNRGVGSQPIFLTKRDCQRYLEALIYYQNKQVPVKYSRFRQLSSRERSAILNQLSGKKKFWVEILAYCLMPNHTHLLLKQIEDKGISKFIANLTNSYVRYFNTKNQRKGPLFQGRFKAVLVEDEEQLAHVSRYIHLNPYSSFKVKTLSEVEAYPFSSLREYLDNTNGICQKETILANFKSNKDYERFVLDQANYQRELDQIKHLFLER